MSLVEKIRDLCKTKNLTLKTLEKEIGFGNGSIRKWDEQSPSVERLQKVADFFDVSVDYIMGRTNHPKMEIPEALKKFDVKWIEFIEDADKRGIDPEALQKIVDILGGNEKPIE